MATIIPSQGATTNATNSSTPRYLTATQIPCCLCGTMIYPNAANQCPTCLAQNFNLQDRLQRGPGGAPYTTVYQCRECRRYQRTEKHWESSEPESSQLLALCLKQIPALQHSYTNNNSNTSGSNNNTAADYVETNTAPLHIVDAKWIWTEPHCMRFKLHLTVRTELSNVPVQQRCAIEMHVSWKQCPDCQKEYTSRTWHAIVQVRQKSQSKNSYDPSQSKNGLTVLENALGKAKANVRQHVIKIDNVKAGFDFYFMNLANAQAFVSYLQTILPMRIKTSHKLVSTDSKNNTAHIKHTITADIVPILRHDLLLIHKATPKNALAGKIALVLSVSSGNINLQDTTPLRNTPDSQMELSAEAYYKHEKNYVVLQSSNRMIRFVVLDIELCDGSDNSNKEYKGPKSGVSKYALADVEVARESDMGINNGTYHCITHLGHLLKAGDIVLGYDIAASTSVMSKISHEGGSMNEGVTSFVRSNFQCPDVVLVKKVSSGKDNDDYDNHDIPANMNQYNVTDNDEDNITNEEETIDHPESINNKESKSISSKDEQAEEGTKPRMSKKKQRRRLRQQGKRRKQLEESAIRMGFIEGGDHGKHNNDSNNEEEYDLDGHHIVDRDADNAS